MNSFLSPSANKPPIPGANFSRRLVICQPRIKAAHAAIKELQGCAQLIGRERIGAEVCKTAKLDAGRGDEEVGQCHALPIRALDDQRLAQLIERPYLIAL